MKTHRKSSNSIPKARFKSKLRPVWRANPSLGKLEQSNLAPNGPGTGPRALGGLDNWGSPELGLARQTGRSLDLNMAFGMDFDDFRLVFIGN